jgi:hypothetical protein
MRPVARRLASIALASIASAACGDGETLSPRASGASSTTGTTTWAAGGAAQGGAGGATTSAPGGAGGATTTTSSGGAGGATTTGAGGFVPATLSSPQLVHGAAYVDAQSFPLAPLQIAVTGTPPDALHAMLDGASFPDALKTVDGFLFPLDAQMLGPGAHTITFTGDHAGDVDGTLQARIVVGDGSLQWTSFGDVGPAAPSGLVHDVDGDRLLFTWWSVAGGDHHRAFLSYLDGGLRRIEPESVVLSEPDDDALGALTTVTKDAIGVVYRTPKPGDIHWLVKMRIVDHAGQPIAPTMDLTAGESAFVPVQIGHDPGGVSAAWLHIPPPVSPKGPNGWGSAPERLISHAAREFAEGHLRPRVFAHQGEEPRAQRAPKRPARQA